MTADGADVTRITDDSAVDMLPAWSPSGEWIAFVSERNGNPDIYLVKPDGTCLRRLTDNPGDDMYPAWRPESASP
jgi:Tol biopolymer transport system component